MRRPPACRHRGAVRLPHLRLRALDRHVFGNTQPTSKPSAANIVKCAKIHYAPLMLFTVSRAPQSSALKERLAAARWRAPTAASFILGVAALAVACSGKNPPEKTVKDAGKPKIAAPAAPPAQKPADNKPVEAKEKNANPPGQGEQKEPVAQAGGTQGAEQGEVKEPANAEPKEAPQAEKPAALTAKQLFARIASLKTSDEAALGYLKQVEALGSTAKERALAANDRGQKLFSKAERADRFFAWAEAHYDRHPLPSFNRAKIAAIQGNIAKVKEHLRSVQKRKGKKLLQKVGFDPTFALVHDDPEVRSIVRGH